MTFIVDGTNGLTFPNSTVQASAGQVLQVVNATTTTQVISTTTSFVATTLTATITPKFATSKILVLVNQNGLAKNNNTSVYLQLLKSSTVLCSIIINGGYTANTDANYLTTASTSYLDSPATTSATTYSTQFASRSGVALASVQDAGETSTITLLEIAG